MKKILWVSSLLAVMGLVFSPFVPAVRADNTVTIVLQAEPDNFDPSNSSSSVVGRIILHNVVEPLTEINPNDSSLSPRLATSWKQVDPLTWHFTLRKGVKFHDGEDFNAKSAIYGIERIMDKNLQSKIRFKFFSHLKMELRAVDSHVLEIKTDKPEPILPTLMGIMTFCSPKTPMGKYVRNPVGTGPYRFVRWDQGEKIVLERSANYWGVKPEVEKATYVFRGESSVRAAMVKVGEADIAPVIAAQDATSPDMDYSFFNSETTNLMIALSTPPLNDRRVRLALNYAVDRNAIIGSILSKDVVAATQLVVPSINGHNPALKVWPYDPGMAKKLLDEARKDGVPVNTELLLIGRYGNFPNVTEVMEAIHAMYKAVGLNVKLRMLEVGVYYQHQNKPFPEGPVILQSMHDNNFGDAVFTVYNKYHCNGVQSRTCDKSLDKMIEEAQVALGKERTKRWQQIFKTVHKDLIADVMLFHMVGFSRVGKRIDFKPTIAINSELQLAQIRFKQ